MKIHAFALSLFCLPASTLSYASDWVYATSGSTGSKFYVDRDSIVRDTANNTVTVWEKQTHYSKYIKAKNKTETNRKDRYKYYCNSKQYMTLSSITYSNKGEVIASWTNTYPSSYDVEDIVPDTVGETQFNAVCNNTLDQRPAVNAAPDTRQTADDSRLIHINSLGSNAVYFDLASIKKVENGMIGTMVIKGVNKPNGQPAWKGRTEWKKQYDCVNYRIASLSYTTYKSTGEVASTYTDTTPTWIDDTEQIHPAKTTCNAYYTK